MPRNSVFRSSVDFCGERGTASGREGTLVTLHCYLFIFHIANERKGNKDPGFNSMKGHAKKEGVGLSFPAKQSWMVPDYLLLPSNMGH